jgi:molybdate transport system permease protein
MNWTPIALSLQVATCATLFAGVIGVALAAWLSRARFWGREWVDVLVTAPMVVPPTVLGYALLSWLGRSSSLGRAFEALTGGSIAFSRSGAIVAASVAALPFVLKNARVAFEEVDPRLIGAAHTLGAGPLRTFFRVRLPVARAGVAAGLALGFARSLGEFGITLMLAGNLPGRTQTGALAVAILYLVNKLTARKVHGF